MKVFMENDYGGLNKSAGLLWFLSLEVNMGHMKIGVILHQKENRCDSIIVIRGVQALGQKRSLLDILIDVLG